MTAYEICWMLARAGKLYSEPFMSIIVTHSIRLVAQALSVIRILNLSWFHVLLHRLKGRNRVSESNNKSK